MPKIKMVLVSVAIAIILSITADYQKPEQSIPVPEKVINSVVIVNGSSGIVVHSDLERSLILTAKHVVDSGHGEVVFIHFNKTNKPTFSSFPITKVEVDEENDLALVEIKPDKILSFSPISKQDPVIGDDIWIASNPNRNYRSLKKGIISSKERLYGSRDGKYNFLWEVSGGVIFGSSGGGIFNLDGSLVATISGVDLYITRQCYDVFDNDLKWVKEHCIFIPTPYIGFVEPLPEIKEFLLKSSFGDYFEYLAEEE